MLKYTDADHPIKVRVTKWKLVNVRLYDEHRWVVAVRSIIRFNSHTRIERSDESLFFDKLFSEPSRARANF
jgi:hypothetical protein